MKPDKSFEAIVLNALLEVNRLLAANLGQALRWRDAAEALLAEHGIEAPPYADFAAPGDGESAETAAAETPAAQSEPVDLELASRIIEGLYAGGVVW